jgi:hypothetical protein
MTLGDQLAKATPAQRRKVANAATVTEAMSVFSKRKGKTQVKRSTRDALRKKLTSLDQQLAKVREPALKKDLRQLKAVIATTIKVLEKNDCKVDMKIVAAQSRRKAARFRRSKTGPADAKPLITPRCTAREGTG